MSQIVLVTESYRLWLHLYCIFMINAIYFKYLLSSQKRVHSFRHDESSKKEWRNDLYKEETKAIEAAHGCCLA
jgi:hypothetical protein